MKISLIALLTLIIIVFFGGYLIGSSYTIQTVYVYENREPFVSEPFIIDKANVSFASISVPAVDADGNGVVTTLDVQLIPGYGRTLANIDTLLFWVDTQNSIRTAKEVAEEITGVNLKEYDIIYTITANASVIEGASAGAALTIVTIAALQNKTVNSSVMITGTINHDGTIGPIGEALEKARAAKAIGATRFLVPLAQSSQITYETKRYCEKRGFAEFCTTETIPHQVKISDEVGIDVREVRMVEDALRYFF